MPCRSRCNGIYDPKSDVQRYCPKCAQWYHVGCLKPVNRVPIPEELGLSNLPDDLPQGILDIALRPIERGGVVSGISGNGMEQVQLRRLLVRGDREEIRKWMTATGNAMINRSASLQPASFMCHRCNGLV
jgi:hypothetical protein